jgi:hypothetical protein
MEPGRTTFWMIGNRVAASLFATVCMYITAGLVDVSAIISRLPLSKLVYLMYLWSGETTVKSAADTTGVSQKTIVQLYQYM